MKVRGIVKWFNVRRGYGFISDADGQEYFVHYSEIQMEGFKKLREGQEVAFEICEDTDGRCMATHVEAMKADVPAEE